MVTKKKAAGRPPTAAEEQLSLLRIQFISLSQTTRPFAGL